MGRPRGSPKKEHRRNLNEIGVRSSVSWNVLRCCLAKFVLALSFLEGNQRNAVVFDKALDGTDKLARDRLHHASGGHFMPAVDPYELQCALDGLELGHIDVAVHPIDAFHIQHNVLAQDLGNRLCYAHGGSGCGVPLRPGIRLTAIPFNWFTIPNSMHATGAIRRPHLTTRSSV
jgi:hypothetical protein